MLRTLMLGVLLGGLAGTAAADRPPQRSYPMTREMYQRQVEFWNDRADLARLYDLAVTFEGGWRFGDSRSIGRVDDRVIRFFDDQLAEANRELSRDLRQGRGGYGSNVRQRTYDAYGREIQAVGGYYGGYDTSEQRREIDELTRLRYQFASLRGRFDQGALQRRWDILQRMIQMEQREVQSDRRWLYGQGWQDPLRDTY